MNILRVLSWFVSYQIIKPNQSFYVFIRDNKGDKAAIILINTSEKLGFYNAITNQPKWS